MTGWLFPATPMNHWMVVLIVLPLATAGLMLLLGEGRRPLKAVINLVSTTAGLAIAVSLLAWVYREGEPSAIGVYLPGNWPVPYGIVLVADHLSALMVVLAATVGLAALLYALARWQHAGVYFHALFQLQLMGLYGAFLTADLFNLFVFFEVMLAASYALLLHGGGEARVRSGLHYVAVNLIASLLFLIGVAVVYGVTGTLNMADIAQKVGVIPPGDRGLFLAGVSLLATAFLAKAALWPLNFWLPAAYCAGSAPAAAVFTILTKVGVYAILRLWTLSFAPTAETPQPFGTGVLVWGGLLTLAFGSLGMLASHRLAHVASYSVIASSGTLLAAVGFNVPGLGGGALFYLLSSTLAGAALFLLVELLDRARASQAGPAVLDEGNDALPMFLEPEPPAGVNLDDDEEVLAGRAIPGALAFLGVTFSLCAMVVAGLPPLSGFVAKVSMLMALLDAPSVAGWIYFALLIVSGLLAAVALMRVGIRHFWTPIDRPAPRLRVVETLPVGLLVLASVGLVVSGERVLSYTRLTAESLSEPARYVEAVMSAVPVQRQPQLPGDRP